MDKNSPVIDLTALPLNYQIDEYFMRRRRAENNPSIAVPCRFRSIYNVSYLEKAYQLSKSTFDMIDYFSLAS